MFGQNPIYGQIPNADPLPGMTPDMTAAQSAPQAPGGMFGGGKFGIGQAIVAALNGYLASQPGGAGEVGRNNMQMMAAMRQRALEHQQSLDDYNRKRADDQADWQTQYDYELAHPKESAGSEYERLLAAAGITPGTPQYQQHVSAKVNQLENPMVMTPYGPMPYSAVNPQVPTAPVGKLTPIDGGPTPRGSAGFP